MKKRGAIYGVITLMLCLAVYLNWSYTKDSSEVISNTDLGLESSKNYGESKLVESQSSNDYFAEARLTRTRAREEAIGILETSKNTEGLTNTEHISSTITKIAESSVVESRVETLIKAKGFSDVIVFINDADVSVVADKNGEELEGSDVAKIKDIVITETNIDAKNIKITKAP